MLMWTVDYIVIHNISLNAILISEETVIVGGGKSGDIFIG